jgi:hypothetical protein
MWAWYIVWVYALVSRNLLGWAHLREFRKDTKDVIFTSIISNFQHLDVSLDQSA